MAKYTGPVCKLCRREGLKLFLKGTRCLKKDKCAFESRKNPPGPPPKRRPKLSDYAVQLREKQKVKRVYGVRERQFRLYYERASSMPGITGEVLLQMLERRLDNAVYRMGFASSRAQARNFIAHGHVQLNGHKANITSELVSPEDEVTIDPKFRKSAMVEENIKFAQGASSIPDWVDVDFNDYKGTVKALPARESIMDVPIKEQIIVELYSK